MTSRSSAPLGFHVPAGTFAADHHPDLAALSQVLADRRQSQRPERPHDDVRGDPLRFLDDDSALDDRGVLRPAKPGRAGTPGAR